jgi:hypothetical protein
VLVSRGQDAAAHSCVHDGAPTARYSIASEARPESGSDAVASSVTEPWSHGPGSVRPTDGAALSTIRAATTSVRE